MRAYLLLHSHRTIPIEFELEESDDSHATTLVSGKRRFVCKWIKAVAIFLIVTASAFGANNVTLKGKVTDAAGEPIEHATVMVYHAGVKHGYSTFCPAATRTAGNASLQMQLERILS
jgi:hypothetical protein